jgi:hypothetical protein
MAKEVFNFKNFAICTLYGSSDDVISFEARYYCTSGKKCKVIGESCCKGRKRISNLDDEMITLPSDNMLNGEEIYYLEIINGAYKI